MQRTYDQLIARGALIALAGYLLSGPVAFILTRIVAPQPAWVSAKVFSENYHVVQDIPYYFGFLLIAGMLMISAGHYLNYKHRDDHNGRFMLLLALCLIIVFSGLISFNYICQTTFIRNLALSYQAEFDPAISTFSMANTHSLAWAIEMWGYAILGVATALTAPYYAGKNRILGFLLTLNGVVSVGSALLTVADIGWVMTSGGLISYFGWNVLMIGMMTLIYQESQKPQKQPLKM